MYNSRCQPAQHPLNTQPPLVSSFNTHAVYTSAFLLITIPRPPASVPRPHHPPHHLWSQHRCHLLKPPRTRTLARFLPHSLVTDTGRATYAFRAQGRQTSPPINLAIPHRLTIAFCPVFESRTPSPIVSPHPYVSSALRASRLYSFKTAHRCRTSFSNSNHPFP
ncbi:hypothetical protein BOTBODRAFT_376853 [Botryobasidium botryosum FD-172 SS1]|uniref:Uncharacterized protein n=1 Tax=Botryobasidium botryosum (strain FD-172 SS1) TaxID=930990 RepID=A0A067N6M6_BOTB1|nr:hypothetical protein BOTBODRAFT_376853 [Botryobasidium botryosum FD-172 SS1]